MILGGVNFGMTFPGLYIVEKFGRRPALITGALWMFMCFLVFASLGHFALENDDGTSNQGVGYAMITFACLFIAGYAMTWGPIVWAVVGEIYPSRYRAKAMALATASNWTWNFLISFCKFLTLHIAGMNPTNAHSQSHPISRLPSIINMDTSSRPAVSSAL
jgi:SP family sugar:H+ symporter-like MFS transporter